LILPITNVDVIGDVIGDVMWSRNRLYILLQTQFVVGNCSKLVRTALNCV